jgi:hypothetical protein
MIPFHATVNEGESGRDHKVGTSKQLVSYVAALSKYAPTLVSIEPIEQRRKAVLQ